MRCARTCLESVNTSSPCMQEGGQKRKHTLYVVATTFNVGTANMSLDQEQWRLDWSLEPKQ